MIKRAYVIIAALVTATGAANAQEDLNRSVDVSKDYAPRVDRAAKLGVQPQLGDTVTLRPDLEYTVRPRAWAGGFGVAPIRAAQMNAGTYNAQYPLYIKAGGGYPGQTLFDLYATSVRPGAGGFGLYANHRAQLADLENYYDVKQSAKSTTNSVGVFGKSVFGRLKRLSVACELGFDYDVWSDHGAFFYSTRLDQTLETDGMLMQHYATPRGSIVFGNDFTDLSFLNFRVAADGYAMTDRLDNKETGGRAFVEAGKQFGIHRLIVGAEIDAHEGRPRVDNDGMYEHGNVIASVDAGYKLVYGNVTFGMGGRFAFDKPSGHDAPDSRTWFLPRVELKIAAADEFNPYALMTSGISPNSYRNVAAANPFWFTYPRFDPQPARVAYEVRAGINGTLGGMVSYNIYAGGGIVKNDMLFQMFVYVVDQETIIKYDNTIYPEKKRKSLFAGAELEARLGNGFALTAAGRYDKYDSDIYNETNYLPKYTASLGVSYNHRDKWSLRAGVEAKGGYEFLTSLPQLINDYPELSHLSHIYWKAPAAVNVTLAADYFLSERLGVFLEGDNLANQKLYPLPFYRGVGINVSAGVKLRF